MLLQKYFPDLCTHLVLELVAACLWANLDPLDIEVATYTAESTVLAQCRAQSNSTTDTVLIAVPQEVIAPRLHGAVRNYLVLSCCD